MYKALYRKYRPVTFDDVFGQETIVKTLQNSIKNNSYSHAYMFFGPRGTGKTSISKIFARSLNCLEPENGNSCGKCKNCLNSYQKECVDIIEIDAASNNGVDEIRELKNKIALVPAELKYKVYIIDEVHMLSIGAFNALLKTLEEPPAHVVFILATTDPQKVPETIISRCQCFSFKRIPSEKIIRNLRNICNKENIECADDVLEEIAYSADGGMRDALSTLDQLHSYCDHAITLDDFSEVNGSLTNREMNNFYQQIFSCNYAEVLSSIKKYNDDGKNVVTIIDKLMRFLRGILVDYYVSNKKADFDVNNIHNLVLKLNEKMFDIKRSSNPTVYIEMLLLEFMNNLKMDSKPISNNEIGSNQSNSLKMNPSVNVADVVVAKPVVPNAVSSAISQEAVAVSAPEVPVNVPETTNLEPKKVDTPKVVDTFANVDIPTMSSNISKNLPINIEEIMKIRVNNTMAKANKNILTMELSNLDLFNDYTYDPEIGYVAVAILDSKIRAASEDSIILSYEYDSVVKNNLLDLNKMIEVYNQITNSNKKIAIITDAEWEESKNKYIENLRNGITLNVIEEPAEVFIEEEKNDIIGSSAIDLFGDEIVEIK